MLQYWVLQALILSLQCFQSLGGATLACSDGCDSVAVSLLLNDVFPLLCLFSHTSLDSELLRARMELSS